MELSFNSIYKIMENNNISDAYIELLKDNIDNIPREQIVKILSLSALLIEREELEYQKLAYYIVLKYSILTDDYSPLYEISYKLFNMPVIELLDRINNIENEESLIENIYDSLKENFKEDTNYYTGKQKRLKYDFFKEDAETTVVAPTSFGKTELIKEYIQKNYSSKNICVVLPSKAMINQLRLDVLELFKNNEHKPKIITHYDININKDKRNIFIFTQERLFKLIYDKRIDITFDTLLIDEAHNLFEKDNRNKLLARIIILLKNKNKDMIIKYFSPVIDDYTNIDFKYLKQKYVIDKPLIIKPVIKIEEIAYITFMDKEKRIYDQFFNQFIPTNKVYLNEYDYLLKEGKNKNIVYLNKPRECVEKAFELAEFQNEISSLEGVSNELKKFIHKDYDLAQLIKKGIVYHNGIVPENVRLYLENVIRKDFNNSIKYVFATSTLLEGVNMPFDNMFIMDTYKGKGNMSYQDLKNLIGRVNRYSTIFNKYNADVRKLLPKIHFVKTKDKERNNFEDFIKNNLKIDSRSKKREDALENPLLTKVLIEDENEKNIIKNLENETEKNNEINTEIGKYCLENNITEFEIKKNENVMQNRLENIRADGKQYSIMDLVYILFIENVEYIKDDFELLRLENEKARAFYTMFINWKRNNVTYNEMINNMLKYWKDTELNYLYIGSKWGECKRLDTDRIPNYVRLITKTDEQKVNYAIKKIKIENDFIDYKLMKYIEILFKLELIDKDVFNEVKYGTSNEMQIYFQREGLSQELSKKIVKEYDRFVTLSEDGGYNIDVAILYEFDENEILKIELEYFL